MLALIRVKKPLLLNKPARKLKGNVLHPSVGIMLEKLVHEWPGVDNAPR